MKKKLNLILLLLTSLLVQAQTGIGTRTPHSSAILDINSPNKGILLPRVALVRTTDHTTIPSPQNSMFIYNTASNNDVTPGYYYWSGSSNKWIKILDEISLAWYIHGNSETTAETHFIGTTDNVDLIFKRNNIPAGRLSNATLNTSFGVQSLESLTTATRNTAIGHSSLKNNLTGNENTAIGINALRNLTTGSRNIAIGPNALAAIPSTNDNIAIGYRSMHLNTVGDNNITIGAHTLSLGTTGSNNIAIGNSTLPRNTGNTNIAIGHFSANHTTSGNRNLAMGSSSFNYNSSGNNNTALGNGSLQFSRGGSNNTSFGFSGGPSSQTFNAYINLDNTTAIGTQAVINYSNSIRIGSNQITSIIGQVPFSSTSDRRFKENIQPIPLGLDFVNRLNPVEYIRKNNTNSTKEWGLIAQELRETLQEIGYTDASIVQEDTDEDKTLTIRYTDLIAPVIKAIQELTVQNEGLKTKIETFQSDLNQWKTYKKTSL